MIKKSIVVIIAVVVFAIGLIHVGYRFRKAYKSVEIAKKKYGYKIPCRNLPTAVFTKGEWVGVLIDTDIAYTDGAHNIVPYDLDRDGKMELIANSYRADSVIFYRNDSSSQNPLNWSRHIIDSDVGGGIPRSPFTKFIKTILKEKLLGGFTGGAHYTAIADMNNDGRDDLIVAGDLKRYDIVWYEAPEDMADVSLWVKHIVYRDDSHRTYHVETGDVDGDGCQDIVFTTKTDNGVGWLGNNKSSDKWHLTWVDTNCVRSFNARIADIDKDGQNDIIASEDDSTNGGELHIYCYSNNPKLQKNWINYTVAKFPKKHGVSVFEIVDIDRDGDLDIVTGNHQGDIYILENPYPDSIYGEWNKYKVNNYDISSGHDFREIDVGDINSDGELDIVVADEGKNMLIWFENSGITFNENWKEHVIDQSDQYLKWCHSVEIEDIDGDGDLDIAVAAAGSNIFLVYFNNASRKDINQ